MKTILTRLAWTALVAAGASAPALAATEAAALPTAPAASQAATTFYRVLGFRSALFGMTQAQVRAAIDTDFHPAAEAVSEFDSPVEMTKVLVLHLDKLAPGPGPCNISYIFGATRHQLMHVNVSWSSADDTPDADQRKQMALAGTELADFFAQLPWPPNSTRSGAAPDNSFFIPFVGVDAKQGEVEVRLTGVPLIGPDGKTTSPTGPVRLRVAYDADIVHPDLPPLK